MLLHLKIIEAKDLPPLDANGGCDGYCVLKMGNQKAKTRTIDNSLNPKWRNEFHFRITNYETDILNIEVFDYDKVGKDDKIGYYQISPKYLVPGEVTESWVDLCKIAKTPRFPKLHIVTHLSDENDTPFVRRPFSVFLTYVRVIEAVLEPKSTNKLYCEVTTDNKNFQNTAVAKPTDKYLFEEEFCFCTPKWEDVALTFNLKENEKTVTSKTTVNLSSLEFNKVKKDWFDLVNKDGTKNGKIRLAIHVLTPNDIPFSNEEFDPLPKAETLQVYIRVIAAKGLKALDVGGTSDPYCVLYNIIDEKNKKKTRIINKNLNPRWNELFCFDIPNIGESQIVFSVYDHDIVGKDDLIGKHTIAATDMGYGQVIDQWIPLKNGRFECGSLRVMYHVTCPGAIPFTNTPFSVYNLYVNVLEGADVAKMDLFGKSDPFCKVKLNFDKMWNKTMVIDNTFWPVWNNRFQFVGYDLSKDKLQIQLLDKDVTTEKLIGTNEISLEPLVDGQTKEYWLDMIPAKGLDYAGKVHVFVQALPVGVQPFQDVVFVPLNPSQYYLYKRRSKKAKINNSNGSQSNSSSSSDKKKSKDQLKPFDKGYTLYVNVMNAINLPAMDSNGYSDGYCILSIKGRKGEKKTSIIDSDLDPVWNESFSLNVLSLSSDVLKVIVKDHDIVGKDDLIGTVEVPVKYLKPGEPQDLEFNIIGPKCQMHGKLYMKLHLARKEDKPFERNPFTYRILNVRVMEGKNCGEASYFRMQFENDLTCQSTAVRSENKWYEELHFPFWQPSEKFKISLYSLKKKEKEVSTILIPNDFQLNQIVEKVIEFPKTKISIKLIFNVNEYGKTAFESLPPLKPIESVSDKVTLNIRIIEATDVPSMDPNGKSDPYCKIKLLHRKEKPLKTRIIKKTLTPVWYQDFHIEIKSLRTDVVKISLIDYDAIGSDDKIGYIEIPVSTLEYGHIIDQWFNFTPYKGVKKGGIVHMILHLANKNQVAFQENPFIPKALNLLVIDAKDLPKMDIGSLSDPYCLISTTNDVKPIKTQIKYNTLTPSWDEYHQLLITDYDSDNLKILVRDYDKVRDDDIGTINIPLKEFKSGFVYNKWFNITPVKGVKKGGQIHLQIHVDNIGVEPFSGEFVPPPPLPAGDKLEIQIHLIQAFDIPSVDANGKADPYVKISFIGREKNAIKSRRIDNTLTPRWDEQLRMNIISYGSDILRLELYDFDSVGKDDRISFLDIPLSTIPPGITQYGNFNLTPLHGHSKGGVLEMKYQITAPGQVPYVDAPFIPYQLNVRLVNVENCQVKDKEIDSMFSLKLKNDTNSQKSSIKHKLLNTTYNQDFYFLVTDPKEDILVIDQLNTYKNKNNLIGNGEFPLKSLEYGKTIDKTLTLTNKGNLKFYAQLSAPNQMPFSDIGLPPPVNDYMTLYVKLIDANGIPGMDNSGLSDPYCKIKLKKRKNEKKTEIKYKTLTPIWNQEFEFQIKSYATDTFVLNMYDYDKFGKDDKIGKLELPIISLTPGFPEDKYYPLRMNVRSPKPTMVHLMIHLAAPGKPKFVNEQFKPDVLNLCICEAIDIPKTDNVGKTDPYCLFNLTNDIRQNKTNVLDNTLTPQWFGNYKLLITDYNNDKLNIIMKDEGNLKDTTFASLELPLNQFKLGHVYDEWFNLTPEKQYKNGGKLRLKIHIDKQEVPEFQGIIEPKPPLPPCQSMELCIKLLEAQDLPICDVTGSDAYCVMEFIGQDNQQKSRIIDNSLNPKWNQEFRFKVLSLNSDEFKLSIWDYDKLSKDDLISTTTFLLRSLEFGKVYDKWFDMMPYKGNKGGKLHMIYQLVNINEVPFIEKLFIPYEVHFRLSEFIEFERLNDYYCEISVENEIKCTYSNVSNNGIFYYENKFLLTDPNTDKIKILLYEHYNNEKVIMSKPIAKGYVTLNEFQLNQLSEKTIEIKGDNINVKAKVLINILPVNTQFSFNLPTIIPFVNANKRYFNIYIKEARNLPRNDIGKKNSTDAYVKLYPLNSTKEGIKGKKRNKNKRYLGMTRVIPRNLNPVFNQIFHIPIESIGTDIIKLIIYDHDKVSRDDKLETFKFKVNEMGNGIIKERWLKVKNGELHVIIHVSDFNQPAFVEHIFNIYPINVFVHDAYDITKLDVITCCKVLLKNDISKCKTNKYPVATTTPQWKEKFRLFLNNYNEDKLIVQIYHTGHCSSQCELPLNKFEPNYVYDEDYELIKDNKNQGRVHLLIHIDTLGKNPFDAPPKFDKFIPKSPKIMFNLHVIEIKELHPNPEQFHPSLKVKLRLNGHKKTKQKTRVVKSAEPFYNQYFQFKPKSLNTDTLQIRVRNASTLEYITYGYITLRNIQFGSVVDDWYQLNPRRYPSPEGDIVLIPKIHLRYQITEPNAEPFIPKLFVPKILHFHLSSLIEPKQTKNDMFFNVQLEKDIYPVSTINQNQQIWEENFQLILTNPLKDKLLLTAYEIPNIIKEKITPKKVFDTKISLDKMIQGQITDLTNDKVKCFGQILNYGEEAFVNQQFNKAPIPQIYEQLMLHIHLVEAINLPFCDVNLLSDPYCEIKIKHRKGSKIYSPYIRKTLNPKWNYVTHIPIQCLDDDIVKFTIRDYDVITSDEKMGEINVPIKSLNIGQVEDKWYDLNGFSKVHIVLHVTGPGSIPFVPQPLELYQLHLKVNEATLEKRVSDVVSKYDPYVVAKLNGILLRNVKTRYLSDTSAPQWYETFTILLNYPQTDNLTIQLKDYNPGKDKEISKRDFKLNEFQIGKTYSDWYTLDNNKDKIHLRLQIVPYGVEPFLDFKEEHIKLMNSKTTLYINIIEAFNLAAMDAAGNESDAYCVIETLSGKKFKTRMIDNSKNPKWNQYFNIDVLGYDTDSIKISVYDHDTASRDDLIGFIEMPMKSFKCGIPEDKVYDLIPAKNVTKPGQLHLVTHLAAPGKMSFVEDPFIPLVLNVRAITLNPLKNVSEPYLTVQVKGDVTPQCSAIRNAISDDFHILMTTTDNKLLMCLMSHSKTSSDKKVTDPNETDLNGLELNNIYEKEISFGEIGSVKIQYQITQFGINEPFNNMPLMPSEGEQMQVHIRVLEGSRIIMKKNRMSYCIISLRKQKKSQKLMTRIASNGLWNDILTLNVISLNTDEIKIQLMEHRPDKKDKKIAKTFVPLINIKYGSIIDNRYQFTSNKGEIHLIANLAAPLQKPFTDQPTEPLTVQVIVAEAVNCPNVDKVSKNDTYCRIQLENDIRYQKSTVKDDSSTPQWFESYDLYLTDQQKDNLVIRLADKNIKFDKEFGEVTIPLKDLQVGVPITNWYQMKPLSGFKKGGVLNATVVVLPFGAPKLEPLKMVFDSIPNELVKSKENSK
ncbi:C2 domain containing protein [Histomonas meleagridis]|uniref:C2 domain containing protein n=1 Tax=Histomonas meleagridis TaxID=135588 RepID=UPI00355AA209|nr:C2 domain containing protein [Histomonas meleagridis]KAH0797898.1 C2 domain containing protein [Histomonas meleagridis]